DLADDLAAAAELVERADELREGHRESEAVGVCDEVLDRFGQSVHIQVQERVASALLTKAIALESVQGDEAALAVYDELLRRFSKTNDPETLVDLAWALYDRALVLHRLDRAG